MAHRMMLTALGKKNLTTKMIKFFKIWLVLVGSLTLLCLMMLFFIFVTELDTRTIERAEEYQKLKYYQTLNKIYERYADDE